MLFSSITCSLMWGFQLVLECFHSLENDFLERLRQGFKKKVFWCIVESCTKRGRLFVVPLSSIIESSSITFLLLLRFGTRKLLLLKEEHGFASIGYLCMLGMRSYLNYVFLSVVVSLWRIVERRIKKGAIIMRVSYWQLHL